MSFYNIYTWLVMTVLLAVVSCTSNTGEKEHSIKTPYQNASQRACKPLDAITYTSIHLSASVKFNGVVLSNNQSIRNVSDTLKTIKSKDISLKVGEEALLFNAFENTIADEYKVPAMLSVRFDNDIFDNTDYYYTNGIRLALYTKFASRSPLDFVLLKPANSIVLRGFSFTQNMYTPTEPEIDVIPYGDYPFSGFLTFGQFSESYNIKKRLIVKSSIEIGVLGPASLSGTVQASVHEKEPVGWKYQISNNLVLNYSLLVEKGIVSNRNFEWNVTAEGQLGTLFDNIRAGTYARVGKFIPVIRGYDFLLTENQKRHWQYWFFVRGDLSFVAYNATLQGGLFNDNSPYTISLSSINRWVVNASAGVAIYYGNMGLELENIYHSPEFKGAYDFRYGRISLLFGF